MVDSNVIISAYTCDGETRNVWRNALGLCELLISPEILAEVEKNLRKAEFHLPPQEIRAILLDILRRCNVVRVTSAFQGHLADEKDRHLASLASEANAEIILTGDRALLSAEKLGNIQIMDPRSFVEMSTGQRK